MEIGFSGEAFGNWIILSVFIIIIIVFSVIFLIAHKRGVDTTTHRFQVPVFVVVILVLVVIPFWLTDLTVKQKTIVTILACLVGVANYIGMTKAQNTLMEYYGIKKGKKEKK